MRSNWDRSLAFELFFSEEVDDVPNALENFCDLNIVTSLETTMFWLLHFFGNV